MSDLSDLILEEMNSSSRDNIYKSYTRLYVVKTVLDICNMEVEVCIVANQEKSKQFIVTVTLYM